MITKTGWVCKPLTRNVTEATQAYVSVFLKLTKLLLRTESPVCLRWDTVTVTTLWELVAIDLIAHLSLRKCEKNLTNQM